MLDLSRSTLYNLSYPIQCAKAAQRRSAGRARMFKFYKIPEIFIDNLDRFAEGNEPDAIGDGNGDSE